MDPVPVSSTLSTGTWESGLGQTPALPPAVLESGLEHSRRLHEDTKAGVPTGCSVPLPGVGGVSLGSCTKSAARGLNFRKEIS